MLVDIYISQQQSSIQGVATNDQAELSREGIKAREPVTPIKPSEEEVRLHQLTHTSIQIMV
eukprot:2221458-Amphidinium_carterae.1